LVLAACRAERRPMTPDYRKDLLSLLSLRESAKCPKRSRKVAGDADTYDPRRHHYFEKLLALDLRPGFGNVVTIHHDPWCGIYQGGYCNCDPELVVTQVTDDGQAGG